MAKPNRPGRCTGRCEIDPDAHQPSPLVPEILICRFCKQTTRKGELLPGMQAETPGQAQ
jgi:hypothetical protein